MQTRVPGVRNSLPAIFAHRPQCFLRAGSQRLLQGHVPIWENILPCILPCRLCSQKSDRGRSVLEDSQGQGMQSQAPASPVHLRGRCSRQAGPPPLDHRPTLLCHKAGSTSGDLAEGGSGPSHAGSSPGSQAWRLAGWSPLLSHHSSSRSPEPLSSGGLEIWLAKTSLCKKTSVSTPQRRTRLRLNLGVFFSLFPVSVPFFLVNNLLNGAPDGDVGQVLETVNCQGCHVTGRASVSLTDWQG